MLSRIIKVNLKCLRVPTSGFARQKCITSKENPKPVKSSRKAIKKLPKVKTKDRTFGFCTISKDRICHILSSIVQSPEKFGFNSDGSTVLAANSENAQI